MTKMLDVLEHFLNLYGYTYLRLDGSTKVEERQKMMDRFNSTDRYFIFILSTRSGGVGINLTGADTVIFYDSDWNPAMDAQAQDRCHRIGQTREVHIYRLISEHTVEENILQKSRQKSEVNRMVLSEGNFTVDAFKKWGSAEVKSLFGDNAIEDGHKVSQNTACPDGGDGHTDEDGSSDAAAGCRGAEGASEPPDTNMEAKSMSEVRSAMASAEDDDDIAAATQAELESSATVEEFEEDKTDRENPVALESKARQDFLLALKRGRQGKDTEPEYGYDESTKRGKKLKNKKVGKAKEVTEEFDWENDLLPIQKYAMNFLVKVYPMVDTKQSVDKLDFEEQEWELDKLQQLKLEEELKLEADGELLFYEVAAGGRSREVELNDLREKFFAAQHAAFVELAQQQAPQMLEVGPLNPPVIEPEEMDELRERPAPPPVPVAPEELHMPEPLPQPKKPKFTRKQIQENKRKMDAIQAQQKIKSAHEVSGDGDGLFNVLGCATTQNRLALPA
jgi:E1A-binding protein p400